ncbi:pirin family protein [Streptomyces sp. NPDC057433]|uniref:pirin family protein n=1 Tax=Streptomyces sp. NPDC057433 TaxID=3346132 RepID=UPI0036C2FB13
MEGLGVDVLSAREVPLGGPRAMRVRRTLPRRRRTLIGAWCFADHYGPHQAAVSGGMNMPPRPHTGLQTVSWLFGGEVEHRDTLGTHALIRPGGMNLMTGGHGIAHSEVSTPNAAVLHGVQSWVALPEEHRRTARDFQHYVPEPAQVDGAEIRVFLGSLVGRTSPARTSPARTSPARTFTPLLGAEIVIEPRVPLTLAADATSERGLLVGGGGIRMVDTVLRPAELGYVPRGADTLTMVNGTDAPARAVLIGGPPFGEEIVMWWNFVGRSHEDMVKAREDWEALSGRFGVLEDFPGGPLPAPALPNAAIAPRRNPPAR